MITWPDKKPSEVLDYYLDWSRRLEAAETITSSIFVAPSGLTIDSQTFDAKRSKAWLSGGDSRRSYRLTCEITTSAARTLRANVSIAISE